MANDVVVICNGVPVVTARVACPLLGDPGCMIAIWPAGLGFAREAWMVTLPEALGELTVNVAVAGLDPLIDVGLEPPSEYVTWIPLGLVVAVPTSTVTSGLAIWLMS